jgi:hypothetical protein
MKLTKETRQALKDLERIYNIAMKTRGYGNTTAIIKGCRNINSILIMPTNHQAKSIEKLNTDIKSYGIEDAEKVIVGNKIPVVFDNSILQMSIGKLLVAIKYNNKEN